MDKLWAPWRVKYVTKIIGKAKGCVFCRMQKAKQDKKNYIFARTKHSFAVLNIYPYNNGHTLIVPNRHVKDLERLTKVEREDLMDLLIYCRKLSDKVLTPAGYNVGINLGRVSGAGIPGHLHIHMVPRWKGDVNFMPVTAETKVISQSLQALFDKLHQAHRKFPIRGIR
jgi:ATP adenylyltransferase